MGKMTEQQMEELADIVADKVFNLLLKKQTVDQTHFAFLIAN